MKNAKSKPARNEIFLQVGRQSTRTALVRSIASSRITRRSSSRAFWVERFASGDNLTYSFLDYSQLINNHN